MVLVIINYAVRILIIIIGLVFLSGLFIPAQFQDRHLMQVLGFIFVLWGVFRLITYINQRKKYKITADE